VIDAHADSARRMCAAARVCAMAMQMSRGATRHRRRCITALTPSIGARVDWIHASAGGCADTMGPAYEADATVGVSGCTASGRSAAARCVHAMRGHRSVWMSFRL
jgi:hypothetical protein